MGLRCGCVHQAGRALSRWLPPRGPGVSWLFRSHTQPPSGFAGTASAGLLLFVILAAAEKLRHSEPQAAVWEEGATLHCDSTALLQRPPRGWALNSPQPMLTTATALGAAEPLQDGGESEAQRGSVPTVRTMASRTELLDMGPWPSSPVPRQKICTVLKWSLPPARLPALHGGWRQCTGWSCGYPATWLSAPRALGDTPDADRGDGAGVCGRVGWP